MKKINLLMIAFLGAATFSLTSCSNECKDVVCENGGTCNEENGLCECPENFYGDVCETECINGMYSSSGTCDCDEGYEDDKCDIESSEKFLATYDVNDDCVSTDYTSTISKSSSNGEFKVLLSDFGAYLCNSEAITVEATVSGTDITIEEQTFCSGASEFTIKGNGSINASGDVITINYSGNNPGGATTYNCTATLTKK